FRGSKPERLPQEEDLGIHFLDPQKLLNGRMQHLPSSNGLKESLQHAAADRMLKLPNSLCFDLPDPLASHPEDLSNLFQRVGVAIYQSIPELDDLSLAVGQGVQHLLQLFLEHLMGSRVDRGFGGAVLDEIAKEAIIRIANGPVEGNRMLRDLDDLPRLFLGNPELVGDLFDRWLPPVLLDQ